jgi:DNA-binding LytR/AlgR family response regulator
MLVRCASPSRSPGILRVMLCEPDSTVREQLRPLIQSDPVLMLAAESQTWRECEEGLAELVPEILIGRADLIPAAWRSRARTDGLLPVVITLQGPHGSAIGEPAYNRAPGFVDSDAVRASLSQAVRKVYDRKARQLLYLLERYISGSNASSEYKYVIRVDRDGQAIDLPTGKITSIVAAQKHALIHSTDGDFIFRKPIQAIEARLDHDRFMRINRSVIINRCYLVKTRSHSRKLFAVLQDGLEYPVGFHYRDRLSDVVNSKAG